MAYRLIIHDENYGTEYPSIVATSLHDEEPPTEFVVDLVRYECGQVAVLEIGEDDDFQTKYIMTIK